MASQVVRHGAWKTVPPAGPFATLPYSDSFSQTEFEALQRGLLPSAMEDKWFVFWEADSLFLHRSWTGFCVYRVEFQRSGDRFDIAQATVAANSEQYRRGSDRHEAAVLDFLIRGLLLHQPVEFPMPSDVPASAQPGLYQHHIAGTGFPERTLNGNQTTVLARLKRLLRL